MRTLIALIVCISLVEGNEVFAASAAAGDVVLLTNTNVNPGQTFQLTQTGGSVFNPFPFAGASAPLVSSNTSIFNPFPFTGAAAPLAFPGSGVVTTFQSGSGSAPFFPSSTIASTPSVAPVVIVTSSAASGSVFNPFPLTGANAPLLLSNTSVFNPFPSSGAAAPLSSSSLAVVSSTGGLIQSSTVVLIQNPEPASWILLGTGLMWLAWRARKRVSNTFRF